MITADEALDRLRAGNLRFQSAQEGGGSLPRAHALPGTDAQEPFAIILGCSDSRVPAEIVFDQGLGDFFVIRVAGNIVAPSQIGSVEFAATKFATPLVVVLGHSHCGAVQATLDYLRAPDDRASANSLFIVERARRWNHCSTPNPMTFMRPPCAPTSWRQWRPSRRGPACSASWPRAGHCASSARSIRWPRVLSAISGQTATPELRLRSQPNEPCLTCHSNN